MRKLTKLSLVAAVAVAGLTTSASAVALEEAIKGVDVSGYVRYRLTETTVNDANSDQENEYKAVLKMSVPVDDNMKVGLKFFTKGTTTDNGTDADPTLNIANAYFAATLGKTSVTLGKQDIKTPITDEARGTGILALNTSTPVTLAAAAFSNAGVDSVIKAIGGDKNIYALAAIAPVGPVNAQLWAFAIDDVVESLIFAQADAKVGPASVTAQFATTDLKGTDADNNFFGIEAAATLGNIDVSAGYNQTDEEGGLVSLDGTDASYVGAGEQTDYVNMADSSFFYATVNAPVAAGISVGADYIAGDIADVDSSEFVVRAAYAYNKKLKFKTYYSILDSDNDAADSDKLRVEAKYSF